jgi:predicted negative regulator of RcsB-dependent stress response
MKITKTAIAIVLLSLFSAFSIVYISWNVWNNFKLNQMRTAATQGYQQAIIDVATAANKCEQTGVPLNVGTDSAGKAQTITIVGVSCLQQAQAAAKTPAASTTPAK